jgi:hypothetical protein
MGNIAQSFVKGNDWSARVDRQYVVSPGSLHPTSGGTYEIRSEAEIIEAPQWFIDWCLSQKIERKDISVAEDGPPIPIHTRDNTLTSIAGKLRQIGLGREQIYSVLSKVNQARCQPPKSDDDIERITNSICRYEVGKDDMVLVGGKIAGSTAIAPPLPPDIAPSEEKEDVPPIPKYPEFPYWVMAGTSIYNGLVKPICSINTRYAEFMFMASLVVLLNYLGTKVRIEEKDLSLSLFLAIVGRKGITFKSSSVNDTIRYFKHAGIAEHDDMNIRNAEGRAIVFSPSSPEGLGKEMNRLMCRNGILFYDEFKKLTNKASIDCSALTAVLLSIYEAGKFQNMVKSSKDNFSFLPGEYCASLIVCDTDRNFQRNWSALAGDSTGLDDRFFFLYQPEKLKELIPLTSVDTAAAAIETRKLIEKAILKGSYAISNQTPLKHFLSEDERNNRAGIRAEKFSLAFAVDLGLDEIDEECIERGLALARYEQSVKEWLSVFDAETRESAIQQEIMHTIYQHNGDISQRELERQMHFERYGTTIWTQAISGLVKYKMCRIGGTGVKGDPYHLIALRPFDEDE